MRLQLINDIKSEDIDSAYVIGPFDKALVKLQKNGYELISLLQNAGLRIQEGTGTFVSQNGNWVKENGLYIQGKGRFITKDSPVLEDPKKATQAHRNGEEYFVSDDQAIKALEDSIKIPYDVDQIPTNRFGDDEITRFCFGENAEKYGLFLEEAGILNMPLRFDSEDYIKKQGKSYAKQLGLSWFGNGSVLYGDSTNLDCSAKSRGIKVGAEDTEQN